MNESYETLKNSTVALINDALDFLKSNRSNNIKELIQYPSVIFSRDVATIRVQGRRQLGHTELIKELAFRSVGYTSCVVTKNIQYAYSFEMSLYPQQRDSRLLTQSLISRWSQTQVEQFIKNVYNDEDKLDICFIDNASLFEEDALIEIYTALHQHVRLFVLMQ